MTDATRAAYSSDDKANKCAAVLSFDGSILKVTTKDCDWFCGAGAAQFKVTRRRSNALCY